MTKSNTVESILSDDQRTSLSKDNLSINRLKTQNKNNSEKVNQTQCHVYATLLSTPAIWTRSTKMDTKMTASVQTDLLKAGYTDAQKKKKSDKLSWLHQHLVVSKDAFAGKNDVTPEYILGVMTDNGITSEAKLMEICNPNREADRTPIQKVVDATVGRIAKCNTKYKGGWEKAEDVATLIDALKVALAERQTLEQETAKNIAKGKTVGAEVKKKQEKVKKVAQALAPAPALKSTTNIAFN